jgi:CRISPR-associated endoribonuclease Cas6
MPYTVSTLLDKVGQPIRPGTVLKKDSPCWLRITAIGDELAEVLLADLLYDLPKALTLYKMEFKIEGYTLDPSKHPWAGQTSFSDIGQDVRYVKSARKVRLEFASPTAFRSSGNEISLPLPGQIFRSLWHKWNTYAPEPMQIQGKWPAFADACILVNELKDVNTVHWKFAEGTRGTATGFTGTVGFQLSPRSKMPKEWQAYNDGAAAVMQSLAQFAFYAGVGHHSTVGMGQARPVPIYKEKESRKRTGRRKS